MSFTAFCSTCPFFALRKERVPGSKESYWDDGECRKNAPYGQGNKFPQVNKTDWCGDHPENSLPTEMVIMEPEDPNHCVKPEWKRAHVYDF